MTSMPNQSQEWADFHRQRAATRYPKWPNEAMLKLLFGKYAVMPMDVKPEWSVLDVGCGFGNNLVPFCDIGCDAHGLEIDPEISKLTTGLLAERGYKATVSYGSNREIPYGDSRFDLVLSVNALHYEGEENLIRKAIREFRRVLKPDGTLYVSTVGPAHTIQRRAKPLGAHRYQVSDFDFRNGEAFFFFDDEATLGSYLRAEFSEVEVGRVTEDLMTLPLDFLVAVARA
jgi:SAM-dependent methyltransferase